MSSKATQRNPWCRLRNVLLAITAAIVLFVGWIALDIWLVYTDEVPSGRPFRAQILEYCTAGQPEGENGWPALAAVLQQVAEVRTQIEAQYDDSEFTSYGHADTDVEAAIVVAFEETDFAERLQRALSMPRYVRPWFSGGFMLNEVLPLARPAQTLSRALGQRVRMAAERGEWAAVVESLHLANRLADVLALQPIMVYRILAVEVLVHALETMRDVFNKHAVPPNVADEIIAIIEAIDDIEIIRHLEYDRLSMRHTVHWLHGSHGYALPLVTLFDTFSGTGGLVGMTPVDPLNDDRSIGRAIFSRWVLASRDESAALIDRWYDAVKTRAEQPYATRWNNWPPADLIAEIRNPRFAIVAQFLPNFERLVDAPDNSIVELQATHLMAVIEQFQAAHGRPPASLDELVPDWIDELPIDPLHGGSFGYKVLEDDPHGRAYLLYTFGPDGIDNEGHAPRTELGPLMYRLDDGTDFELNRPVQD